MKNLFILVYIFSFGLTSSLFSKLHDFAVCAMFKNEAKYLKEWIEYHKLIGATKFYLYNNDSTDNYIEILSPYIEVGLVSLIDWSSDDLSHAMFGFDDSTFVPFQYGAYNDCLRKKARWEAKWLAIIDIDEFLVPTLGKKSFLSYLEKLEKQSYGCILLRWRCFGTSFLPSLADGKLLIEELTRRSLDDHPVNRHVKSIYRPQGVNIAGVHMPYKMRPGFKTKAANPESLRIHHYWARTEDVLLSKRGQRPEDCAWSNIIEDKSIFRYIPALKKAMHID
jgi:hypothetical protein